MKKLVFVLLLLSAPAWAEWTLVALNDNEKTVVYADLATIRKSGNMAKMWSLYDYKTVRRVVAVSILSHKDQNEYDCGEERYRTLYSSWYSGNMGSGDSVFSDSDPKKWDPLPPESVIESLWKVACHK